MRALLRVVEQLQRTQEAESLGKFNEFFKTYVLDNAANKAQFEKIAATASQAIMDHF